MIQKQTAIPLPLAFRRTLMAMAIQATFCGALASAAHAQTAAADPAAQTQPDEQVLPVVKASARRENADAAGPVRGYVARRSATATKTDTPLAETPRSISVITREQIEAQNPSTLQEALGYTPGVFAPPLATSSTDSTASLSIRGFRASDGDVFYQDGTRAKFPGWWSYSGHEPYAFERIEVLRGPASILYGQGQPNGTINMVSKRPTASPLREVGVEIGSFDRKELSADVAGPLSAGSEWSYRITGLAREGGTQIDHAQDKRYYLAGALAWRPSARTELVLRTTFQRNEGEPNNNLPAAGTVLPNPNGVIPRQRAMNVNNDAHYDTKGLGWTFVHQASDVWTLRSVMRLSQTTGRRQAATFSALNADNRTAQRNVANYWSMDGNHNLTLDNGLQARFSTGAAEHTVLLGLDHARQKDGWQVGGGSAADLDLFSPIAVPASYDRALSYERTARDRQTGVYVQDQVKFDKRWVLSLGGRKDWAKGWAQDAVPGEVFAPSAQKDEAVTWQAGAAHLFGNGITPYANYAESFVPVGAGFQPETGRQYEAGVKFQPTGSETLLTAAVFDLRKQNVVTRDPSDPTGARRIQTGEVASRGLELEARSEVRSGLRLIGSYAYTKTEITKNNDGLVGKALMQAPRHSAALWVDQDLAGFGAPGLSVAAGVRHVGTTWGDEANTLRVPGYTLVDLGVRYDLGRASAALKGAQAYLNVKNLGDKTYLSCFYDVCQYGIERSVSAGVRYSW